MIATAIDDFIDQVRASPKFTAAAGADPVWSLHMDTIEFCFIEIDRRANDDPELIDVFDKLVDLISDERLSIKERLLGLFPLLTPFRNKLQGVRH